MGKSKEKIFLGHLVDMIYSQRIFTKVCHYCNLCLKGNLTSYFVNNAGDFELCFNNRHSMLDSKTVIWEYDVVGEEDEDNDVNSEGYENVNATMEEYLEQAEKVRRSVIKVRGNMARSKHTQWWLNQKVKCVPKNSSSLLQS